MMNKPVKKKKCASCKNPFSPRNSMAKVCKMSCALDYAEKESAKRVAKDRAQRKRDFLANDVKFQKAKAQKAFNEFIRLRDAHLGCVSCDKGPDWQGQWAAGHYRTVGSRPDLRFNEDNAHKQCNRDCNMGKSGNVGPYRVELERRIGTERLASLESDGEPKRYRAEDYAEIAKEYAKKAKELRCKVL